MGFVYKKTHKGHYQLVLLSKEMISNMFSPFVLAEDEDDIMDDTLAPDEDMDDDEEDENELDDDVEADEEE